MKVDERNAVAGNHPRPPRSERRPAPLWPLLMCLGFLSIGGFVGGVAFVVDRTGAAVGAKLSWLEEAPVDDFLFPGLFLLGVYAIGGLILMAGLAWRISPAPLRRLDSVLGFHWSWRARWSSPRP